MNQFWSAVVKNILRQRNKFVGTELFRQSLCYFVNIDVSNFQHLAIDCSILCTSGCRNSWESTMYGSEITKKIKSLHDSSSRNGWKKIIRNIFLIFRIRKISKSKPAKKIINVIKSFQNCVDLRWNYLYIRKLRDFIWPTKSSLKY